jgi:predicted Zn finger-like uncharacterized protein
MIVQCEQCNTRFKLDDSKVREEGVKVRCSKCRHIFIVRKEQPEQVEEADFDTLLSGLIAAPQGNLGSEAEEDETLKVESRVIPESNEAPVEAAQPESEFASGDLRDDFSLSSFGFEPEQQTTSDESSSQQEESPFVAQQSNGEPVLNYSSDFGFAESTDYAEANKVDGMRDEFTQAPASDEMLTSFTPIGYESAEFAFDGEGKDEIVEAELQKGIPTEDRLSIEESSLGKADSTSKEDDSSAAISWDFSAPLTDSIVVEPVVAAAVTQETALDSMIDKSMPLGETAFQESQKHTPSSFIAADDEPAPNATASRKRSSSVVPLVVTSISVLVIFALAGAGFFILNKGPAAFDKIGLGALVRWVVQDKAEEGNIVIRNATSEFLNNKEVGEIFVIRGEAVNAFRNPRASIQVKATLFSAKGPVVGSRTSYCGNPLTKAQLTTMPLAKIESAMGNQFGDSLVNLGVQPGKAIPFVIVLSNVPKDASEFGLEIVGSTVASQ